MVRHRLIAELDVHTAHRLVRLVVDGAHRAPALRLRAPDLAPETFLARVVALGEHLVDRADVDTVFSHALERVAPLRRLVRSELAVRHDPPPDLAVAALAGELERERPCRARPREEARHVAPPRFALECVQQRGADATTPVIRMHTHPDVLCAVRPRHEADRDRTVTDDRS